MNVRELFGNISGTYDLLNRVLSFGADQRWRKRGVRLLPHGKGLRVLDLAAGTLDLSLQYLNRGEGEVYGVDFSMPMLLTGHMKVSPTLDPRLHLVCGDGLRLPFPEIFFDAAMCGWGVRNFSDPAAALQEIRRVLKPSAPFLILEFFRPVKPVSKIFSQTYGRYVMPAVGRWLSKNNDAYEYLHRSIQKFFSRGEYENLLKENGFRIQHSKDLSGGVNSLILATRI